MTIVSKIAMTAIVAGGIALSSQAVPITGSISFNGNATADAGLNGTGGVQGDLTLAKSIVFGSVAVAGAGGQTGTPPTGSFAALSGSVTMTPLLNINPALVPGTPVWSVGGFSLTLLTLGTQFASTTSLTLYGTGTFSDGIPADSTAGNWTATFTSSGPGSTGITFGFNASSAAIPPSTPEAGTSVLLLGLGLAALGAYAQCRKQVA